MEFCRQVARLAQKDPDARRAALEAALQEAQLEYTVQTPRNSDGRLRTEQNYLLKLGDQQAPCLLFCAHYDAVPGSLGANDNAAAVSILLALAKRLRAEGKTAEFAFFDAEEQKRAGSKLYVQELEKGSVTGVVNLDLCGYGDTLVLLDKGYLKRSALRAFADKKRLERQDARVVKYLPESDDVSFRSSHIPTLSLAIVPRWDVQYLNTLATFGGGFLGRTPEFEMILGQMEVCSTMHGNYRDTLDGVQESAMQRVFSFLLEACGLSEEA